MSKKKSRFRKIETYDHLARLYQSWADGYLPSLAVVGRGGLGKSFQYEGMLQGTPHLLFKGRTSAISLYESVKDCPNHPIVFDDIRALLKDSSCLDLLKQLCDSRPRRVIQWRTQALPPQDRQFTCTSNVLVILNWVPKDDADVEAILDRFDIVEFVPTKTQIISRMRQFAKCQQDVDIIANAAATPSLRTLKKFEAWKKSPLLDEAEELYSECGVGEDIRMMMDIMTSKPKREWIETYQRLTGKTTAAAKMDWTRKRQLAEQLLEAQIS